MIRIHIDGREVTRAMRRLREAGTDMRLALDYGSSPQAWGTLSAQIVALFFCAVHPHRRGERGISRNCKYYRIGSSPRVWGTRQEKTRELEARRFIPTGVGNAIPLSARSVPPTVHPHGCGERLLTVIAIMTISRFIPTGVGNARSLLFCFFRWAVHPHGCGERLIFSVTTLTRNGSSPRVWGTRPALPLPVLPSRFIPTGVGNA